MAQFDFNLIKDIKDFAISGKGSQGDILKNIKKLNEYKAEINAGNYPGSGMDIGGNVRKSMLETADKVGNRLSSMYEKYTETDGLEARERFDLPPLKDGLLGIKAAGSEQGMAQAKVLRDIKSAKDKQDAKEEPYDGPFGKLGEYFSKNADKRDELFDYISAIGQQLVRPTNPGEARGFLSDVSQGLTAGQASIAAKDAASLDALVKRSEAASNIDPIQNYSSKMKEVRQEAINNGYEPGTKAYSDYVGAALRGMRISSELEPLLDSLKIAKDRQMINPEDEGNNNIIKNLENRILALQSGGSGTVALGGSDNDISYLGNELTTKK